MEHKQYWGVCVGEGKEMEIVRVFLNYDQAIEEFAMFTLETGVSHSVQPVKPKKELTK